MKFGSPVQLSKILIIDDSKLIHRLLHVRVMHESGSFISAVSGGQGVEMAKSDRPDLILLDINMGQMDGFETLIALKHASETTQIPVIFLSGSDDSTDKVRGFELGAIDYITKPFDSAELRARVRSALRMQRLVKMLSRQAQIDALTGLWNRAYFDTHLASTISAVVRYEEPASLLMCDLDKFKNLNDAYGHQFGDTVLMHFADVLREQIRDSDTACRYGGEEFAVILPKTQSGEAAQVAERIRFAVENVCWLEQSEAKVTASFGVASINRNAICKDITPADILAAADKALYDSKDAGRNCITLVTLDDKGESCNHESELADVA